MEGSTVEQYFLFIKLLFSDNEMGCNGVVLEIKINSRFDSRAFRSGKLFTQMCLAFLRVASLLKTCDSNND